MEGKGVIEGGREVVRKGEMGGREEGGREVS